MSASSLDFSISQGQIRKVKTDREGFDAEAINTQKQGQDDWLDIKCSPELSVDFKNRDVGAVLSRKDFSENRSTFDQSKDCEFDRKSQETGQTSKDSKD